MSIDSQLQEMTEMAVKEGIFIKEVRKESHSAKLSGSCHQSKLLQCLV